MRDIMTSRCGPDIGLSSMCAGCREADEAASGEARWRRRARASSRCRPGVMRARGAEEGAQGWECCALLPCRMTARLWLRGRAALLWPQLVRGWARCAHGPARGRRNVDTLWAAQFLGPGAGEHMGQRQQQSGLSSARRALAADSNLPAAACLCRLGWLSPLMGLLDGVWCLCVPAPRSAFSNVAGVTVFRSGTDDGYVWSVHELAAAFNQAGHCKQAMCA